MMTITALHFTEEDDRITRSLYGIVQRHFDGLQLLRVKGDSKRH